MIKARVKETSTTSGTGTLSLGGAVSGFRTFIAGFGTGNPCYYTILDGTAWEVGIGTVTSGTPDTLSRTTVLDSSAAGAKLMLSAGSKYVYNAVPADVYLSMLASASNSQQNDFRLSLTSALPVTTADVTAAGTLYAVPYTGNRMALYDGTNWILYNSAQLSLVLTLTSGKPYDVFCYASTGVPTLEVLVWTNDSTRATALTYQDGVLVKAGDTTRRYLGTLYASGANVTEDSAAKRYLYNYYHRRTRFMSHAKETTNTWTYTTATYRQANANAANQVDFVQGVAEDLVEATVLGVGQNSSGTLINVGIGLDSTSANSATLMQFTQLSPSTGTSGVTAKYTGIPAAGKHSLVWLEISTATGTTTWSGDAGDATRYQAGLIGSISG